MLNIYLNHSACNYFQTKYSIVCNFKSIIARCEHKQSVSHLTSSELESLISHEIQKLYDTIEDSADFNQLFNGHGHDWIRNGHKKRIISCYEYSFHTGRPVGRDGQRTGYRFSSSSPETQKIQSGGYLTLDMMRVIMGEEKKSDLDRVTFTFDTLRKYFPKSSQGTV